MQPGQPILSDNTASSLKKYQGLIFYGEVTTATSSTECKVAGLAGLGGDDILQDYYLYCNWDSGGAGAAPQKEHVRITSYTDADGTIVHNPFTADLVVGDKILVMHSILFEASGGGGGGGDIEIFDSFEYPSDAALQAEWLDGGYAADSTRSATAYEGRYSMQTIVGAGGVGYLKRFLVTRNMKTFANIGIASQSSVGGDTFQFTLYDSNGNYNYWTQTCNGAPNTWTYHNINPHSISTGGSATLVDLADIVEIRVANLTASSTYKFDFIKFSSLVGSKIGIGYSGLSDTADEDSSVRGHLLFINDNIGVPAKDATADALARDVVGKKEDDAQTTVGTTRSIIAYVKGILNQIVDVMGTGFVTADDSLHAISVELTEILDLTRTGADIAVTVTETNLFIDDAPSKIINGISIKIDTTDMGAGDTYEFREYYRIENAGSYIEVADTITLTGAQSDPLYIIPLEPYRYGCKVTAQKTAGTDRAFPIEAITET